MSEKLFFRGKFLKIEPNEAHAKGKDYYWFAEPNYPLKYGSRHQQPMLNAQNPRFGGLADNSSSKN